MDKPQERHGRHIQFLRLEGCMVYSDEAQDLSFTEMGALSLIAYLSARSGVCTASYAYMGEVLHIRKPYNVMVMVRRLEKAGWLTVIRNGSRTPCRITLTEKARQVMTIPETGIAQEDDYTRKGYSTIPETGIAASDTIPETGIALYPKRVCKQNKTETTTLSERKKEVCVRQHTETHTRSHPSQPPEREAVMEYAVMEYGDEVIPGEVEAFLDYHRKCGWIDRDGKGTAFRWKALFDGWHEKNVQDGKTFLPPAPAALPEKKQREVPPGSGYGMFSQKGRSDE